MLFQLFNPTIIYLTNSKMIMPIKIPSAIVSFLIYDFDLFHGHSPVVTPNITINITRKIIMVLNGIALTVS